VTILHGTPTGKYGRSCTRRTDAHRNTPQTYSVANVTTRRAPYRQRYDQTCRDSRSTVRDSWQSVLTLLKVLTEWQDVQHAVGKWYNHNVKGTDRLGELPVVETKKTGNVRYNIEMIS